METPALPHIYTSPEVHHTNEPTVPAQDPADIDRKVSLALVSFPHPGGAKHCNQTQIIEKEKWSMMEIGWKQQMQTRMGQTVHRQ